MKKIIAIMAVVVSIVFLFGCGAVKQQMAKEDLHSLPKQLDFKAQQAPAIDYTTSVADLKKQQEVEAAELAKEPKITASFVNESLVNALSQIQMDTGINILPADNVQGVVSVEFKDESLSNVLDMLCYSGGFEWKKIEKANSNPYYIIGSVIPGDFSNSQLLVVEKIKTNRPALKVYDLLGQTFQPYVSIVGYNGVKKSFGSSRSQQGYYSSGGYNQQQSSDNEVAAESYELVVTGSRDIVARIKQEIKTKIDPPLKQIAVQIVICEDSSINEKKYGVNWSSGIDASVTSGVNRVSLGDGIILGSTSAVMGQFLSNIQAMKKDGKLRIKDAPQLMTREGYPATFKAEGQRWFKIDQPRTINQQDYSFYQKQIEPYRYGTIMQIVPIIADNGDVVLRLSIRMNSANSLNNNGYPIIGERLVESEVQMASGATMVLAGQDNTLLGFEGSGIPGLKDLPIVRAPFSMQETKNNKTKLIVFVTAWIIEPNTTQLEQVITKTVEKIVEVEKVVNTETEKEIPVPYVDPDDWKKSVDKGKNINGTEQK